MQIKISTVFVTEDGEPVDMGPIKAVMFEDGCGNLIHLVQPLVKPE